MIAFVFVFQGELTGLCGNFDLKTINELRTPDNFELTNSQEFGNSWTAVEVHRKTNVFAYGFWTFASYSLSRMKSEVAGNLSQAAVQNSQPMVLKDIIIH